MSFALVLTYHAVERGPAPLCVDTDLFREHLDVIAAADVQPMTVLELATALGEGGLDEPAVTITFDDGFASVAENAAPLLAERGLPATVFCVAGHLGGTSGWRTARAGGFRGRLATAAQLAELTAAGVEIGSHGMEHDPLVTTAEPNLRREIVDSQAVLEQAVGTPVRSFAYPYGARPSPPAQRLVAQTYAAACTTELGAVGSPVNVLALPRVDVHYLRSPELLERALAGSLDLYLRARRIGARARRLLRKDYASARPARFGSGGLHE